MQPFPVIADDDCFASVIVSSNGVKSVCGVAYKAAVNASGVVRLIPLSTATFKYAQVGSNTQDRVMPCKSMNASGLLNAGSSTSATVTMFDELGGPISNLTKTGSDQITLSIARSYGYRGPGPVCRYNYTVVSGCFMGIQAPSPPPACPARHYIATGLAGAQYCAPCPPGTTSAGPDSKSCTPCPAGTYNANYGGTCQNCPPGRSNANYGGTCKDCPPGQYDPHYAAVAHSFSAKAGASECSWCATSDNTWTDGKKCTKCPAGSYASTTNPRQCHKCKAGVKCCTVNPSKDCPACPTGWTPAPPATSVFALSAGSTPACLASKYALCAPKFNLTVAETCLMTIKSMTPAEQDCAWDGVVAIKGSSPDPKADLFNLQLGGWSDGAYALLSGNVTDVSAPFLDFTVAPKCTLRYRALSGPGAQLLGAAPKPCRTGQPGCASAASTCPAGQYLETQTDTTPAPCLPCPPGTYSAAPSNKRCTPCPLGYFAAGYSSKACALCPAATPATLKTGAVSCQPCYGLTLGAGVNKCQDCPQTSGWFSFGRVSNIQYEACLSNQFGSICCAMGNCSGQPACPSKLQDFESSAPAAGAVLQLVSTHLPQPQCKNATLLTCMDSKAMIQLSSPNVLDVQLDPVLQPRCTPNGGERIPNFQIPNNLAGSYTSPKRAVGSYYSYSQGAWSSATGYQLLADAAKGTITVTMLAPNPEDPNAIDTVNLTQCTATFKLVAGYTFDLAPPAGAQCPANAVPVQLSGRTFCNFCPIGQYKKASTGKCAPCPAGSYQDQVGGTSCKTCPAGSYCPLSESSAFIKCPKGYLRPKAGSAKACVPCPANTYGNDVKGVTSCAACPKFTLAPVGSVACSVPFPK